MQTTTTAVGVVLALICAAGGAAAEPPDQPRFELLETFALGIAEHALDAQTEVTGWRLNRSWYLGRENGEHDAVALVWQGERKQVSISTEGIRFTRRF